MDKKNENNNDANSRHYEHQIDYGESENYGPKPLGSILISSLGARTQKMVKSPYILDF